MKRNKTPLACFVNLLLMPVSLNAQTLSIDCPRTSISQSSISMESERQMSLEVDLDGDSRLDQVAHGYSEQLSAIATLIRTSSGESYLLSTNHGETQPRVVSGSLLSPFGPVVIEREEVRREGAMIEEIYHVYRLTGHVLNLLASIHRNIPNSPSTHSRPIVVPFADGALGMVIGSALYLIRFEAAQCTITRRRGASWSGIRPIWNAGDALSTCHAITHYVTRMTWDLPTSFNNSTMLPAGTRLDVLRRITPGNCTSCQFVAEIATHGLRQRGYVTLRIPELVGDCLRATTWTNSPSTTTQE